MDDYQKFKKAGFRYWERRRIIYNLALMPPAFFGYRAGAFFSFPNDPPAPHDVSSAYMVFLFALAAVGANVCYSFAYALEFVFGGEDPNSRWLRQGRTTIFITGVLFAMCLAVIGGSNIADMEHDYILRR